MSTKLKTCPNCPPFRSKVVVDFVAGHAVCIACGLVLRDIIYEEAGGDEVKTRSLMQRLQPTSICGKNDGSMLVANKIHYGKKSKGTRHQRDGGALLATTQKLTKKMDNHSKWRMPAIESVQGCSGRAQVSSRAATRAQDIIEEYLRTTKGRRSVSNKNVEVLGVVAVYIACREQRCARTVNEVCAVMSAKESDFRREYKAVVQTLKLRVRSASPVEFLGRFFHLLDWTDQTIETRAQKLIESTPPDGDIAPWAVAAAALYLVAAASTTTTTTSSTSTSGSKVKTDGEITQTTTTKKKKLSSAASLFKKKRSRPALTGRSTAGGGGGAVRQGRGGGKQCNPGTLPSVAKTLRISFTQVNKAREYISSFDTNITPSSSSSKLNQVPVTNVKQRRPATPMTC